MILITAIMLLSILNTNAQNTLTPEQKVSQFLGADKYNQIVADNPGLIKYLKYKSEKGYLVEDAIESKANSYIKLDSVYFKKQPISIQTFVRALEQDNFNFLFYTFPIKNKTSGILLGNSGKIIIIYSNSQINKLIQTK